MPKKVNTTKTATKEKKENNNIKKENTSPSKDKANTTQPKEKVVDSNVNGVISPELIAAITQSVIAAMGTIQAQPTAPSQPTEEKVETSQVEEPQEEVRYTKTMLGKIGKEEVIVRSAIRNVTFISPRTNIIYNWLEKGDIESLTINDIIAMENKGKRFLHTPWLIVEDKRVQQALGLEHLYELIERVENVDEIVKLDKEELKKIFNELPHQYRKNFIQEIYIKVKTRELNDMRIIDNLEEILKIDLKNIK